MVERDVQIRETTDCVAYKHRKPQTGEQEIESKPSVSDVSMLLGHDSVYSRDECFKLQL